MVLLLKHYEHCDGVLSIWIKLRFAWVLVFVSEYRFNWLFCFSNSRWMNGQHLRSLPADKLVKILGEQWKSAGILLESEGTFVEVQSIS